MWLLAYVMAELDKIIETCNKLQCKMIVVVPSMDIEWCQPTIDDIRKDPQIMTDYLAVMSDTSERDDFVERGGEYKWNCRAAPSGERKLSVKLL